MGHGIHNDVARLRRAGLPLNLRTCDWGKAHQARLNALQLADLQSIMDVLDVDYCNLHNGGNDALYTVETCLRMLDIIDLQNANAREAVVFAVKLWGIVAGRPGNAWLAPFSGCVLQQTVCRPPLSVYNVRTDATKARNNVQFLAPYLAIFVPTSYWCAPRVLQTKSSSSSQFLPPSSPCSPCSPCPPCRIPLSLSLASVDSAGLFLFHGLLRFLSGNLHPPSFRSLFLRHLLSGTPLPFLFVESSDCFRNSPEPF